MENKSKLAPTFLQRVILPPINEEIEKNNRARRRIINPLQSL
jgi:hypothetical protein